MTLRFRGLALAALVVLAVCFAALSAPRASAADCRAGKLFDGGGYFFDPTPTNATFFNGGSNAPGELPPGPALTRDAWDNWGGLFVYPPAADLSAPTAADTYEGPSGECEFSLGGHEVGYPVVPMHGLEVQRRWYVDPGLLHGARALTVLHNPGPAPTGVTVLVGEADASGSLGSDTETTARASSDGSGVFSPLSAWGVSSDLHGSESFDPVLAHVWDGVGGQMRVSEVVLGGPMDDALYWDWKVVVPPGATAAFVSYEIQAASAGRNAGVEVAQAVAQAEARESQPDSSLYLGMSAEEIAATMNWPRPVPTATIAPVQSADTATPVRLDASASVAATGLPQCSISRFAWELDEGETATGARLSRFFAAGQHQATVTVSNDCGGSRSANLRFTVAKAPTPDPPSPPDPKTPAPIPPAPPPVPKTFALGKLTRHPRAGTATLTVELAVPGTLTLSGRGVAEQTAEIGQAGSVAMQIAPVGKVARTLRRTGRAAVAVGVEMAPAAGVPSRSARTVVLRLRR